VITPEQLPKEFATMAAVEPEPEVSFHIPQSGLRLTDLEKKLVEEALELSAGNQVQAARLLGISRDAFRNRLKKHGLL
jgi:two-component system NtrC family response regulator